MLVALVAIAASSAPAPGATSATVVGANVLSATSIGAGGCLPNVLGRTSFGAVAAGSSNVTSSDCTVAFGSSNDTSSLRVAQLDGTGMAMGSTPDRLQTSFGANGISTLANPVAGMQANGAETSILQPDGKLLGAGSTFLAGQVQSIVYRRNTDGTLDTTFNAPNGYIAFDVEPGRNEALYGIDLQPDGKVVGVGYVDTGGTNRNGTIARVNADGTMDNSFGGGGTGWRVVDLGGTNSGEAYRDVVVEAGGTIVAVGNDDVAGLDDRWVLDRFTSAGAPDPATGGGSGRVTINPTVNQDRASSIAPHPGGGYLVGGQSQPGTLVGHVTRVDATLNVIGAWGAGGHRQIDIVAFYETVVEIEPLPDGTAILAIEQSAGASNHAIVGKLTSGGALDTAGFASPSGFVEMPSSANADFTRGIEVAPTGSIYVAYNVSSANLGIGRVTAAGALDTTFGSGGAAVIVGATNPGMRSLHMVGNTLVVSTKNSALANDSMVRLGGLEVDDYVNLGGAGDRDWGSGIDTNLFGVCLRAVTVASADWGVDGDADCTVSDADPWRAVAKLTSDAEAKVAHTTTAGDSASAMLRFAFRPSRSLTSGNYEAPIVLEVVAPA